MARLNCSHGDWKAKGEWIEWLREHAPQIAILADLQGPKFRVGNLGEGLEIAAEQVVTVGAGGQIPIDQPEILHAMEPGGRLLLGDGEIELAILARAGKDRFEARVVTGGCLKSRKGVTLVDKVFDSPAITRKDLEDVQEAVARGVDFIALSYVKNAADVRELRRIVDRLVGGPGIRLCAKIETQEAIDDLPNILKVVRPHHGRARRPRAPDGYGAGAPDAEADHRGLHLRGRPGHHRDPDAGEHDREPPPDPRRGDRHRERRPRRHRRPHAERRDRRGQVPRRVRPHDGPHRHRRRDALRPLTDRRLVARPREGGSGGPHGRHRPRRRLPRRPARARRHRRRPRRAARPRAA